MGTDWRDVKHGWVSWSDITWSIKTLWTCKMLLWSSYRESIDEVASNYIFPLQLSALHHLAPPPSAGGLRKTFSVCRRQNEEGRNSSSCWLIWLSSRIFTHFNSRWKSGKIVNILSRYESKTLFILKINISIFGFLYAEPPNLSVDKNNLCLIMNK